MNETIIVNNEIIDNKLSFIILKTNILDYFDNSLTYLQIPFLKQSFYLKYYIIYVFINFLSIIILYNIKRLDLGYKFTLWLLINIILYIILMFLQSRL